MISGYSLTGEKCTAREPSQPVSQGAGRYAPVHFSWKTGMSQDLHPLRLFLTYRFQEPGCHSAWTHHTVAVQSMNVSPPLLHTWERLEILHGKKNKKCAAGL